MPEGFSREGVDVEKIAERLGSAMGGIKGDLNDTTEASKEMGRSVLQVANVMGLLTEYMNKSQGVFTDFSHNVERTTVVMQSLGRVIGDVTQNLRGATSSVEGFISAMNTLGTRTFPDVAKNLLMTISGHEIYVEKLKKQKAFWEEEIFAGKRAASGLKESIKDQQQLPNESIVEFYTRVAKMKEELSLTEKNLGKATSSLIVTKQEIETATVATKAFGATLAVVFNWVALVIAATVGVAMAYDASIKAKREVIYTLGRMGVSYATIKDAMDAFNLSFTAMSTKWGVLREDMAKAVAPLTGLGVGVGKGGAEESFKSGVLGKTMTVVEDWTGAMMRLGTDASVTSRAFGVLGTAMNISGDTLGDTFGKLAALGEKSVLGQQRYIAETISMLEITRKYGGEIEGAQVIVSAFGEGIKKGTYSLEAMSRLVTPAMWSSEQKGAMASLMRQFAPTEAGQLGIKGKDIFADMMALERAGKDKAEGGNPEVLAKAIQKTLSGMTGAGMSTEQQAFMMQAYLKELTGAQVSTLEAMKIFEDPVKFAAMLNPPKADTPEQVMTKALKAFGLTKTVGEMAIVTAIEASREGVLELANTKKSELIATAITPILGPNITVNQMVIDTMMQFFSSLKKKGKQSGGYISEEGEYFLHAGEQVRRPGEGTGGNVNVSLGGISVSIGDRGDMGSQINEAFDQIKQETIKEIEKHWEQSLHAH